MRPEEAAQPEIGGPSLPALARTAGATPQAPAKHVPSSVVREQLDSALVRGVSVSQGIMARARATGRDGALGLLAIVLLAWLSGRWVGPRIRGWATPVRGRTVAAVRALVRMRKRGRGREVPWVLVSDEARRAHAGQTDLPPPARTEAPSPVRSSAVQAPDREGEGSGDDWRSRLPRKPKPPPVPLPPAVAAVLDRLAAQREGQIVVPPAAGGGAVGARHATDGGRAGPAERSGGAESAETGENAEDGEDAGRVESAHGKRRRWRGLDVWIGR